MGWDGMMVLKGGGCDVRGDVEGGVEGWWGGG